MDEFKEQVQLKKRHENAKEVIVVFPKSKEGNYQNFNIVDAENNLKYDGFVEGPALSKEDSCKCPSFTNNNDSKAEGSYITTHGHAFQCKHIIAAREAAVQQKLNIAVANDKSHVEVLS